MKRLILSAVVALVATTAHAGTKTYRNLTAVDMNRFFEYGFESKAQMEQYFTITNVQVSEVSLPSTVLETTPSLPNLPGTTPPAPGTNAPKPNNPQQPTPGLPGAGTGGIGKDIIAVITDPSSIQNWVVIGQKIWDVIVANKPVANVSSKRISVLPMAEADWAKMTNWQSPYAKTYSIRAINGFGSSVVSIDYTVAFNYGGKYEGRGQYLANATVIPTRVDVSWAFQANAGVEIGTIVNSGSFQEPIPAVDMQMKWKVDSVLKHSEGIDTFFIRGDGVSERITSSVN